MFALVVLAGVTVAMVALGWVAVQPTRQSVVSAAVALAVLPAVFVLVALIAWLMGR